MAQSNTITDSRVAEFVDIVRGFITLRHRLRPVLPEEVIKIREQFAELLPPGQDLSKHDFQLFFSVGVMLMSQPAGVTMGEISQSLDVPLSTATRIIDQMVKLDYAQRLPDPDDRRIVRVALTATGAQMYENIQNLMQSRLKKILQYFDVDEQESLLALLRKLHDAIIEEAHLE